MSKLYIKQKVFSISGEFSVQDDHENARYIIEGSFLSLPKKFSVQDTVGNEVALITKRMFQFFPKFDVTVRDEKVFTIAKQLSFFTAKYSIEGEELNVSGDWWDKSFTVERHGEVVANITEKWLTWGDSFEIEVLDETLEQTIIALVVAIDCVKHAEKSSGASMVD